MPIILLTPMPPDQWALPDIERDLDAFETLLAENGLAIPSGSPLEDLSLAIHEMRSVFGGTAAHNTREDHREQWRRAIGLADLVKKVLTVAGTAHMQMILPHLKLFLAPRSSLALTTGGRSYDETRNKLFELIVGLASLRDGHNVELEDPRHSGGGQNPDVLATFFRKRWAIACKAPTSLSPKSYADNVRSAVNQIDRAAVDHGIVVVHQGSLINHDAIFPAYKDESTGDWVYIPAANEQMAWEALGVEVERLKEQVFVELGGSSGIAALFHNSRAIPVVANYAAAIAGVKRGRDPVVTILRSLTLWTDGVGVVPDAERVLDSLNRELHDR